jgi:hypothetical protein
MKYSMAFLLLYICACPVPAQAQIPVFDADNYASANYFFPRPFFKKMKDYTFYYPFYNGVQLIEIDFLHWARDFGTYLDAMQPVNTWHNVAHPPNVYILRNLSGDIRQQYNLTGKSFEKDSFLSVAASLQQITTCRAKMQYNQQREEAYRIPGYRYQLTDMPGFIVRPAGGKYGLLDTLGNITISTVYDSIVYDGGYYYLQQNSLWGLADHQFCLRIPPRFEMLSYLGANRHCARNGQCGMVDSDGKLLVDFLHEELIAAGNFYFYKSYSAATGFLYGIIDSGLAVKTPPVYTGFKQHETGGYWAAKESGWGMIGKNGKELTAFKYNDDIGKTEDGYHAVAVMHNRGLPGQRYYAGFLDSRFKEAGEIKYDYASRFTNGFGIVSSGNKYGAVNAAGREVAPCIYTSIQPVVKGFAIVIKEQKEADGPPKYLWGIIDTLGREVMPVRYNQIEALPNGQVEACMLLKKTLSNATDARGRRCQNYRLKGRRFVPVR